MTVAAPANCSTIVDHTACDDVPPWIASTTRAPPSHTPTLSSPPSTGIECVVGVAMAASYIAEHEHNRTRPPRRRVGGATAAGVLHDGDERRRLCVAGRAQATWYRLVVAVGRTDRV